MQMRKSRLVLVLNRIDWEDGTSFVDQSRPNWDKKFEFPWDTQLEKA